MNPVHFVFRVDASLQIGTGHVMRCLTLADALRSQGLGESIFIVREHTGHVIPEIKARGHRVVVLRSYTGSRYGDHPAPPAHASWLGADWRADATSTRDVLEENGAAWLIMDHYALDRAWQESALPEGVRLMVIDDLADRHHICSLLVDQTYGREAKDYSGLVSKNCRLLCGSQYALLRPEFAAMRSFSLMRRSKPILRDLLITMGGVDKDNATGQILGNLHDCPLPADCRITVVMGRTAPWLDQVRSQAADMPWPTNVLVGVTEMAKLMANSDLAIGAAGATTWERCCLGLPTLMVVVAGNQLHAAQLLASAKVVRILSLSGGLKQLRDQLTEGLANPEALLSQLSHRASSVTDGKGCERVVDWLKLEDFSDERL